VKPESFTFWSLPLIDSNTFAGFIRLWTVSK
jgi:hypothetical protein